ncbi:hypothetical protein [Variovorax sp. efr-133-TYG-130]|uniref:hypothetical protein n=1 Tax=Variovorax sp. efr-133-TYG-130 TaxID=3040327 RepID=UPI0025559A00|nr:hypothetical protein [Variovorax sp. efr-133-TYG-130]
MPTEAERFALSYRERKSADLVVNDFAAIKLCPNLKTSKLPGCNPGRPDGWSVDASAALPGFTPSTAPSRGLKMKDCWQSFPRCLLASLAVLLAPTTWACSPIRTIGIVFERNSATVPAKEVLKLANWTAMLRLQYPNRESLFLSTQAAFGEHDASNLGVKRARNVARVLREDLQFDVREVDLPTKGYVAAIPAPEGSDLVKRVNIDFLPACPHECPCQKGDPLYKPAALQR